jgi:hypothetical protein
MLEMIFENSDLSEYYCISKPKQNNYSVEVVEHQHVISIDDEPDWGYYIDLDNTTPPNIIYSKNKNPTPMLNLPRKNYTIEKPIKYLSTIEEEIFNASNNSKSYIMNDINTIPSVISGVTFCATVAFYYFYRTMRN